MANVLITPNMNLPNPVPGVDPGPDYADNNQSCFNIIDGHNHTSGSGVQIPSAGLNINADLSFNNQSATGLLASIYTPQSSLATLYAVYVSGADLYYNDGSGNVIQITTGGTVNATSSGISSGTATASFVGSVLVVNAAANTPANIQGASLLLGNNSAGSKFLTLSPPAAMGSNYNLTLPGLPGSTLFLTLDTSGNIGTSSSISASQIASGSITGGQIANTTITASNIANATITTTQISASAGILGTQLASNAAITVGQLHTVSPIGSSVTGSYSNATTSYTTIASVTLSSPVLARPIFVFIFGFDGYIGANGGGVNASAEFRIVKQGGSVLINSQLLQSAGGGTNFIRVPASSMSCPDFASSTDVSNGSITYSIQAKAIDGTAVANQIAISAFQW